MRKLITLIFVVSSFIALSQNGFYNGWFPFGNTVGTNTAYIGTNDNRSLLFKTNNTQVGKLDSLGNFSLISSNPGFNNSTNFTIKNTSSSGYSKFILDSDDGLTKIGFYNLNSGGSLGSILNNNSAFVVATATAGCGIINTSAAPIIFNTTTYGTSGEGMRIDKNRNVLISGAGPTHPANSGTATALLMLGAGSATLPAIALTAQSTVTNAVAGQYWYETTRGFYFNGRITGSDSFSLTNSTFSVASTNYTAGNSGTLSVLTDNYFTILADFPKTVLTATTTYYYSDLFIGSTDAPRTTVGQCLSGFPYNCTLVGANITTWAANSGVTNEAATVNFRLNGSDNVISNAVTWSSSSATPVQKEVTGLGVSVSANDTWEIKLVTGSWSTNPSSGGKCRVTLYFARR